MDPTASWFFALSIIAAASYAVGFLLGAGPARRAWLGLTVALLLMGGWAWLTSHPNIAVNAIPVSILRYIEGVGAIPFYMVIVGIAWARSRLARQRRVVLLATGMGAIYFLQGSLWMIQSTPATALASTPTYRDIVMQTEDFTCVPAACATALTRMGILTSESEMAYLTAARPGTGSTLIRAMDGLNQKLIGRDLTVELAQPTYEQLNAIALPAITPIKTSSRQLHMVVIVKISDGKISLADPEEGIVTMYRKDFEKIYTGQVLVFVPTR